MYKTISLLGLTVLFIITLSINSALSNETQPAEFTVMQGWLMGDNCIKTKKTPCPLEEYEKNKLVLITPDDQIYKLEKNGVEEWKLRKAYGQLIGLKGLRNNDVIKVSNIVQITGGRKLTKA